ncbi:UbiA prenyltransferase family protein [Sphingobacterium paludis]|uniref:UbiA prenyltransferase family protein n=1 Tax=Sphingobacterium paludis TaxID=1476465 RepID=A0A4R7CSY2_9SPHI|nr:hypothetical protein [Sphingobacterium paludis]TDS11131.1 hypothetical protein B0I21_108191 [Sphingobacterium paludis]
MNALRQSYYFLIHTNLLIAAAAMAQCALTYLFFDAPYDYAIIAIEGAATLLLYNFSLLLSRPKEPSKSIYKRTRWVFKHEWVLWLNSGVAVSVLAYAIFNIHFYSLLFLGAIGLFSVAYSFPIFPYKGKVVGLRQLPAVKIFHIALVWTLSSVCLPAFELFLNGVNIDTQRLVMLFALKFIFLLICTLPFDIRDIKQDSYYHLKTIPNMIGAPRAIRLCYMLIGLHSFCVVLTHFPLPLKIGILSTNLLIALVLRTVVFRQADRYHHAYLLDFALVIQFLSVLLSFSLF